MLRELLSRIAGTFRRGRLDEEFKDEVQAHLEMLTECFISRGMDPVAASYAARRQFGGVTQMEENLRERHALPPLDVLVQGRPARVSSASKGEVVHGLRGSDTGCGNWHQHGCVRRARRRCTEAASVCRAGPADGIPPA